MRGIRGGWLFGWLIVAGCGTFSGPGPSRPLVDLPWGEAPTDRVALRARDLIDRGEPRAALDLVEAVLEEDPGHTDARRLRQDVLRERGRRGLLQREVAAALAKHPDDAAAWYLAGRIAPDRNEKLAQFRRAVELAPDSLWPWLGLAHTLRQVRPDESLAIYERLFVASSGHPLVAIAFGASLAAQGQFERARDVYRGLAADRRVPGVGDLGLAQTELAREHADEAWPALLAALRQRPFDTGVQGMLQRWLAAGASDDRTAQVLDVLRERPDRFAAFGHGAGRAALADLLQRTQQPQAVRGLLERGNVSAREPALRRLQRRNLLALGDVRAFLDLALADLPVAVVGAEPNELRGRWLSLLQGPWRTGEPLASAEQATALVAALTAVGWLAEAELVAETALPRWPTAAALAAVRDDARRELAFEAGVRRLVYQGYRAENPPDLRTVIEQLRGLSQRILGVDVVGQPEIFRVPMVGELLDPFRGTLAAHFDRYNRHFVIGQRAGGHTEGMLMTRLSLRELPVSADLPLPGRCYEVVAIDRDLRTFASVLGGDFAGVALLNHFCIDYDAVREWAGGVADRRRIAAEDGGALAEDPLPDAPGMDPFDVAWRLALVSPVQDNDLEAAVLETIEHHERQHLVDAFHYLPVESNLWRGFGLLLQFGFSAQWVEAEMERRAELASLAISAHTELVLAHIADFLGEPDGESPHHRGFQQLGRELSRELQALGLSPEASSPSRWHLVDRELIRRAARQLLAQVP